MLTPFGESALYLAGRGIQVFPLHTPGATGCSCGNVECGKNEGKHPRLKHGLHDATADVEVVRGWWTRWPDANIGAVAGPESGFWALDIDAETPAEAWLAEQEAVHGELPATRRAKTGGGGRHYYWRYDHSVVEWLDTHGLDLPSRNGIAPPGLAAVKGLDVRAAGGYVVVAPSKHRLGGVYAWTDQRPTVYAPEWLLRAVARPREVRRAPAPAPAPVTGDGNDRKWGLAVLRNACAYIASLQEGQHDVIRARARLVGGVVAGGYLSRDEAEAALVDAGVASGRALKEVQRTVRWGLTKGEGEPVRKPPSRWEQEQADRAARWQEAPAAATLPPEPPPRDEETPPPAGDDPPPPDGVDELPEAWPHCTDVGNAELLVKLHGEDLRWCDAIPGEGWLVWDGSRWAPDRVRGAMRRASQVGGWWRDRVYDTEDDSTKKALKKWAGMSEGIQRIRGMMELAKGDPKIVVQSEDLDKDPWVFNTPKLTFHLRDRRIYAPRREDLVTRVGGCEADSEARCPVWMAFLDTIMDHDQELIAFLQRAVGYSLTGDLSEQCMFILHGNGANGKSTFIEAIRNVMGTYARNTPIETFTVRREGGIPNDVAALAGARFVTAAESQEGMALNEALVKQATGDDVMTARFLNREFFDFMPMFKAWVALNHKPKVRGTDEGIWRRLRLIPFNVTIPKEQRDKGLKEKLKAEASGILNWAIEGFTMWRQVGLAPPKAVLQATDDYRSEMDTLKEWIEDCCEVGSSKGPTLVRDLYKSYTEWCKDNGVQPRAARWFGQQLELKKFKEDPRHGEGRRRQGIQLIVRQGTLGGSDGRWGDRD